MDNVINAMMFSKKQKKGQTETANDPADEASDDSDIQEGQILTRFITKVISEKRL